MWGWGRFFHGISDFVNAILHHFGTASEQYATNVVERVEVCIFNARVIEEHLKVAIQHNDSLEEEKGSLFSYIPR